jgi:acyl carrier protein
MNMLDCAAMTSRLTEIVRQVMPERPSLANLTSDADLYDAGLTSMAMVKLMLAVEIEFDISIPDADLHPDNFRSIGAVEALVGRLRRP